MKFGLSQLRKRTPDVLFRIGNALVAVGGLSSVVLVSVNPTVSAIFAWCAIGGKFLTELFGEENPNGQSKN